MSWFEQVDDLVELFEVDRWVDRAVVHLQRVLKRLQKQFVVEQVRICKDQAGRLGQMLVQVVQPVDRVS